MSGLYLLVTAITKKGRESPSTRPLISLYRALLSSHARSIRLYGEYTQQPLIGHYTYRLHITSLVLVR